MGGGIAVSVVRVAQPLVAGGSDVLRIGVSWTTRVSHTYVQAVRSCVSSAGRRVWWRQSLREEPGVLRSLRVAVSARVRVCVRCVFCVAENLAETSLLKKK